MKFLLWVLNLVRPVWYLGLIRSIYRAAGGDSSADHTFWWYVGRVNDPAVLHKYIPTHFSPKKTRLVLTTIVESTTMNLDLDDHIQYRTFMDGAFDIMPIIMAKLFCAQKVYLDVGANVGTTCLPVANCQIDTIAIEASPAILGKLYRNLSLNPNARILVLGLAVGDQDHEIINMYLPGGGNAGASSVYQDWNRSQKNPTVERQFIFKLDNVIDFYSLSNIGLLKLDIEGHEVPALVGAQALLRRFNPAVLFEWRPDVAKKAGMQFQSPDALFPSGYSFFSVRVAQREKTPGGTRYAIEFGPFNEEESYENVLCLSRNNPDHAPTFSLTGRSELLQQTINSP